MAYDVFISYRRQGGGADARMMYDRLQNCGYTVSFDMDTLKNGNFNEELLKRVAECKNFVVLLSENCFGRTLNGCKREDDWLRIEIATALYNNKNIVTVMLPGFVFPEKLPPDIDAIRNKNGPKYDLYYIDGFYDKLQKDFLVKEESSGVSSVTKLEEIFSAPEMPKEGQEDLLSVIGDDTDFLRQEAVQKYESLSRLLPYDELDQLDKIWGEAERRKIEGDYTESGKLYLKVMDLCDHATPCSSAFVMRMTADEIDTRKRDWFEKALTRAQGGDADYEYGVGSIYAGGLGVAKNAASAFRWFDRAARNGNVQAMAAVGAAYSVGSGVETDYSAAMEWLVKAAEQGLPVAEERLGYLYRNGFGVERDPSVAREWYTKAATLGNSAARAALGSMYIEGDGVERDVGKALSYYREAAADDHPDALRVLAEKLFESGDNGKFEEALNYCRRAVNVGDVEAICVLGRAYENGAGVEKDLKKAGELYQKAKASGSSRADTLLKEMEAETQYALGWKYMEGCEVNQDFLVARSWFLRAANQGHVNAKAWLGRMLAKGLGGCVDLKNAVQCFEDAATGGSSHALYELGELYRRGVGFKRDYARARDLFEKSIAKWNQTPLETRWVSIRAFVRLASFYKYGDCCQRDLFMAARLYRFAARAGNVSACRKLGMLYRDGQGVAKSKVQMDIWFSAMWKLEKDGMCSCDEEALSSLGEAALQGQGIDRNIKLAVDYWRRSIGLGGNAASLLNFGRQHPEVIQDGDIPLALSGYERFAKGGDPMAMANLGIFYRFGYFGIKRDARVAFDWFGRSAACGFGGAMRCLSTMYENGDGVGRDDEKALDWLIKAADNDDKPAKYWVARRYEGGTRFGRDFAKSLIYLNQYLELCPNDTNALQTLARYYRDGIGVEENAERAHMLEASRVGILCRLAEDQKAESQDDLADCYYRGYGVAMDCKKAVDLYEKAALGKNEHAMDQLREFFRFGVCREPDLQKADEWARVYLEEKTKDGGDAARGMPDSCVAVGNYYRHGYGVPVNPKTAFAWYEKGAAKKSWSAMLKIARMLQSGREVRKDAKLSGLWAAKAIAELTPLADHGLAEAQCALADCYVEGLGVERSGKSAVKLYTDAYAGRNWLAAARLARFYALGDIVERDESKAVGLLQRAVERHNGEAAGRLGEYYENANCGLEQDYERAFELYRQSASEGNACGLFNVGRCYENGIGVPKDHARAIMWLRIAAAETDDFWGYDRKAAEMLRTIEEGNGNVKTPRKNAANRAKKSVAKKRKGGSHA